MTRLQQLKFYVLIIKRKAFYDKQQEDEYTIIKQRKHLTVADIIFYTNL